MSTFYGLVHFLSAVYINDTRILIFPWVCDFKTQNVRLGCEMCDFYTTAKNINTNRLPALPLCHLNYKDSY